jgi:hypothetical protein
MKNLIFNLKAVETGSYKAEVEARAGAETNSCGSATLYLSNNVGTVVSHPVSLIRFTYTLLT